MIDEKELVEVMAEAFYNCGCAPYDTLYKDETNEELKDDYRYEARFALKALCKALPDVSGKDGILDRASKEMKIYNQLKAMGED